MIVNKNSWGEGDKTIAKTVNWDVTSECNYDCKFCQVKNLNVGVTDILDSKSILKKMRNLNIEKVNITGGEPLLYPFTYDIIKIAKSMGFVTSIATNGSLLTKTKIEMLSPYLDWIELSVDSKSEQIERYMGRGCGKHVQNIRKISKIIKEKEIKLKINTIVTKLNYKEDMNPLITTLNPDRWMNFQVHSNKKQNCDNVKLLSLNKKEFKHYITLNENIILKSGEKPIFKIYEDVIE